MIKDLNFLKNIKFKFIFKFFKTNIQKLGENLKKKYRLKKTFKM